jgi:uncharacterized protein with HEPN domain
MSGRDWTDRIRDILDAIDEIGIFTQGMSRAAFLEDTKTLRAVELDFIVIGEAVSRVPDDIQEAHPDVPWSLMRALRNRLVHVYFEVDHRLVWDTIQNDLPPLVEPLKALITGR